MGNSREMSIMELPPRARRILSDYVEEPELIGTTSACAENTAEPPFPAPQKRNYLRVRGEYDCTLKLINIGTELPPRARRIPFSTVARLIGK